MTADLRPIRTRVSSPRPPGHLAEAGRALWSSILREFVLDQPQQVAQLTIACEAADTIAACRDQIEADGRFIRNRFDTITAHPAVEMSERAARLQLAAIRSLELDVADALRLVGRAR